MNIYNEPTNAGDTIIFGQPNIKEAIVWRWILHTFEEWFGLKINYDQSYIYFLREVDMKSLIIEKVLECARGIFTIKYLGVPLRENRLRKEDWMGVI